MFITHCLLQVNIYINCSLVYYFGTHTNTSIFTYSMINYSFWIKRRDVHKYERYNENDPTDTTHVTF